MPRPMQVRREPLDVAIAVIEQDGRVLITQRMAGDSFGGLWEFPGGKMRPGERLEECLVREIREELGVGIAVGPKLQVVEHRYSDRLLRFHCFTCRIVEGEPRTIECSAWRWVEPQELSQFEFPPASDPIIRNLQKGGS